MESTFSKIVGQVFFVVLALLFIAAMVSILMGYWWQVFTAVGAGMPLLAMWREVKNDVARE